MLDVIRADGDRYITAFGPPGRKPRWALWLVVLFLTPGFKLVLSIRVQRALGRVPLIGGVLRRVAWYVTTRSFGCDIDPHATFGPGLHIPHPTGIVIGGRTQVGARAKILQNVTIGRSGNSDVDPVIGNDVAINAGAVVVGAIRLGDGVTIGANSVVLSDVPAGAVAVGVPARVLQRATPGGSTTEGMA